MDKEIKRKEIKRFEVLPEGWAFIKGASTAPVGYRWANNRKSRFSAEYEQALVKVDDHKQQ